MNVEADAGHAAEGHEHHPVAARKQQQDRGPDPGKKTSAAVPNEAASAPRNASRRHLRFDPPHRAGLYLSACRNGRVVYGKADASVRG
jgi:hypothetical protein